VAEICGLWWKQTDSTALRRVGHRWKKKINWKIENRPPWIELQRACSKWTYREVAAQTDRKYYVVGWCGVASPLALLSESLSLKSVHVTSTNTCAPRRLGRVLFLLKTCSTFNFDTADDAAEEWCEKIILHPRKYIICIYMYLLPPLIPIHFHRRSSQRFVPSRPFPPPSLHNCRKRPRYCSYTFI